jgi:hypothetical protein
MDSSNLRNLSASQLNYYVELKLLFLLVTVEQPAVMVFKKPDIVAFCEVAAASFKKGTPDCATQASVILGRYGPTFESHTG